MDMIENHKSHIRSSVYCGIYATAAPSSSTSLSIVGKLVLSHVCYDFPHRRKVASFLLYRYLYKNLESSILSILSYNRQTKET